MRRKRRLSASTLRKILTERSESQKIIEEKSNLYNIKEGDSIIMPQSSGRKNQTGIIEFIDPEGVGLLFRESTFKDGPVSEFFEWDELNL